MSSNKATVADGPYAGRELRLVPSSSGWWSPNWCVKESGGEWQHHDHAGDGVYRYAGPCAPLGHEHVEWCDHTWYDDERHDGRHRCDQMGEHEIHRCCCGAEVAP